MKDIETRLPRLEREDWITIRYAALLAVMVPLGFFVAKGFGGVGAAESKVHNSTVTEVVSHPEKFKKIEDSKVKISGKVFSIVNSE